MKLVVSAVSVVLTTAASLLFGSVPATATLYSVTDLGPLGGNFSAASNINDNGQIVGYSSTSSGVIGANHAVLWSGGIESSETPA